MWARFPTLPGTEFILNALGFGILNAIWKFSGDFLSTSRSRSKFTRIGIAAGKRCLVAILACILNSLWFWTTESER
jgi:predicted outer membrane lipoprotein